MILQDPDTEILHKCPHNRDLVQVLLQDPDTSGPKNPHTEILRQILHKLSSRILIQWSNRIPIQRSCTSGRTGSWHKRSKGPWYRDLVQVVLQDPDTSGPKGSWHRDPERDLALHTEILHKWSYRIPTQAVQRIPIQRSCTSGPTRSWYKWSKMILIQRSWDRDLALVLLQDPDKWSKRIRILKQRSCTSGRTGSS